MCPACGSSPRNRRLWQLLKSEFLRENIKILHFSPARCLYRKLKKEQLINYASTDYAGEFLADKQLDITNINEGDHSFDLIICYHILEHIEKDKMAMNELYRILKPGGTCLIQTPFKEGKIYEDSSVKTRQERIKHFGQADHVRIYSSKGLIERLTAVGFHARANKYTEENPNVFGFKENEFIIIASKA